MSELNIETFCLGPFATNCYIAWPADSGECWIIDAGFDPREMIADIHRKRLAPSHLILTHAHCDHIAGVDDVRRAWPDMRVLIHEAEKDWMTDANLNLSAPFGLPTVCSAGPDRLIKEGETLELGQMPFHILHTPGHSPGGIAIHQPHTETLFVGDTLFAGSIGRFDFPASNGPTLLGSIREKLMKLPQNTRVLPGHGLETTLAIERDSNPFLQPGSPLGF